jgi:hypothetical protein
MKNIELHAVFDSFVTSRLELFHAIFWKGREVTSALRVGSVATYMLKVLESHSNTIYMTRRPFK